MKKILLLCVAVLFTIASNAQLMVAKMLGKGAENYGLGYGFFSFVDIPTVAENQAVRLDVDLTMFTPKGKEFFSSSEAKSYVSAKLGYKNVFSETAAGFYVVPSLGYCYIMNIDQWNEGMDVHGVAGAFETGYRLDVGQKGGSINLGIKYEYDRGGKDQSLQSVGLRLAYGFGLRRRE